MNLNYKNKIIFVRLGKIGDIIISSSAINYIKKKYPKSEITLLTLKSNQNVLKYNTDISHLILVKKNIFLYIKLLLMISKRYDILIDLNDDPSSTSRIIRKIIRADKSIGFDFSKNNKLDISVKQPSKEKTHIIDRTKLIIHNLDSGSSDIELKPILFLGEKEKNDVCDEINIFGSKNRLLSINLSAGARIRYWDEDKWIELINNIIKNYSDWSFIILSKKEDLKLRERVCSSIPKEKIIEQKYFTFQHFAAYISQSDVLITPDTSAVHVASSFNIPLIALYPNYKWNFISWQPLTKIYRSIKSEDEFISSIPTESVYNSLTEIIKEID